MIRPEFLNKGDIIGIAAPAGKVDPAKVIAAATVLESRGLTVKLGNHVNDTFYNYAATDENRFRDFQQMLNDPSVKAILCARGGYGTNRIIDLLDFSAFRKNPKWIVGFSDITVLHSHIQRNCGIATIHGCMAAGLQNADQFPETAETLRKALFGEKLIYDWSSGKLARKGKSKGILTGGNLAILCTLIGTSSEVDFSGKILFIEEVGENLYRIDRMMIQLKRAGRLENLTGLIVGGMTEIPDKKEEFGKTAGEIIAEAIKEYDYPVAFGFPAGHTDDNRALILGREVKLEVDDTGVLTF